MISLFVFAGCKDGTEFTVDLEQPEEPTVGVSDIIEISDNDYFIEEDKMLTDETGIDVEKVFESKDGHLKVRFSSFYDGSYDEYVKNGLEEGIIESSMYGSNEFYNFKSDNQTKDIQKVVFIGKSGKNGVVECDMTTSGGHITDDELKKFSDFLSQIKLK
jgi:hypothetical protein